MFSPSRGPVAASLLAALMVASACSGGDDAQVADTTTTSSTTTTTSTTTTVPLGPLAPLTGLRLEVGSELVDQPAIVVKISNNFTVQDNWSGIDQADVVIEERIEDNATRFAVVFHSDLPQRVGPIRSGRTSDIDLLANLGHPILVYSGANPSVTGQLQRLASQDLVELVVDRDINVDLVRDTDFRKPDNLFSDLVEIDEKYGDNAGTAQPLFVYGDASDRGISDTGDVLNVVGQNDVSFVWDASRGYVRVQDGEIHATQKGVPFAFDNVVALEVAYTRSNIDPDSVDANTLGTGPATIFIGGERWSGTWVREARADPYTFIDAAGDPLPLGPGQTWMTLVPANTYDFELDPEIAALVLDPEE